MSRPGINPVWDQLHGLVRPKVYHVSPAQPEAAHPHWVHNDGGRADCGYRGTAGDCVTRAIAIATGKLYAEVFEALHERIGASKLKKHRKGSPDRGVRKNVYRSYLESLGWRFVPTMGIGTGCRVHLKAEELPKGVIICSCSGHIVTVIDGIIQDTYDPSRGGTRCVYGYFIKAAP